MTVPPDSHRQGKFVKSVPRHSVKEVSESYSYIYGRLAYPSVPVSVECIEQSKGGFDEVFGN